MSVRSVQLQELVEELGFSTIDDALNAGYEFTLNYDTGEYAVKKGE